MSKDHITKTIESLSIELGNLKKEFIKIDARLEEIKKETTESQRICHWVLVKPSKLLKYNYCIGDIDNRKSLKVVVKDLVKEFGEDILEKVVIDGFDGVCYPEGSENPVYQEELEGFEKRVAQKEAAREALESLSAELEEIESNRKKLTKKWDAIYAKELKYKTLLESYNEGLIEFKK